ncbi:MAG: NADPH-dependent F420 reductase [Mycobacteriales bacterium]
MTDAPGVIGVLGGTGPQGRGLALRLALAGHTVVVGSRDAGRAAATAADLAVPRAGVDVPSGPGSALPVSGADNPLPVSGADNATAAAAADVVIVAVPWTGHADLLESLREHLAGKIVIDCVNPMGFDKRGGYALDVEEGSAAEQAAALLPDSTIVAAFHHVSAVLLADLTRSTVDCDVLVLAEDRDAATVVQDLADAIPGMRGIYAGRLRNAHQVETLTANLIAINRRYQTHAGIRITGV